MRLRIVSDTHLTAKFDKDKYELLHKLFSDCDRLIINGDFWSWYSLSFNKFVNSQWKRLFPIMLKKETIYIYGNHDREEFMDEESGLFSKERCLKKILHIGKLKYHIEHGHLFFGHQSFSDPKLVEWNRKINVDERIRNPINRFLCKRIGQKRLFKFSGFMNKKIKERGKGIIGKGYILVTGHTHLAESNRDGKYVNTGFIDQGFGWYLEIGEKDYCLKSVIY